MKNISFDNPYLLLIAIPLALAIIIPYLIIRNKDNKTLGWFMSLCVHIIVSVLISLAAAGIMSVTVMSKTTVYVVADLSYSTERDLDKIDEYIAEIKENLPQNSNLGVVCFGKDTVVLSSAGRTLKSVKEAQVDGSATNIAAALGYTETLFKQDVIKRIVLITDGNDTVNKDVSSIASTVNRLVENGVKIDTIFLNSTLEEGETEVQLSGASLSDSAYLNHESNVSFLLQSSGTTNVMLELFMRDLGTEEEFERIGYTVVNVEAGLDSVTMTLPTNVSGEYEYKALITADDDISEYNNECTFRQTVVGKTRVLLVTGKSEDVSVIGSIYGEDAEIDSYVVSQKNNDVPFTIESIIEYDEIIVSNVDIRDINNANAFIDSLDDAVSQYGKSLITLGNLYIQTEDDDPLFTKFQEILPVDYGNYARDGKLYTIVLDVSHSMFMAYKFTIARDAAVKLVSLLNDDDYICLVTFSGEIKVRTPVRVGDERQKLIEYIDSLYTSHGTDIGLGLEEAMKAIKALNLSENQVMLISDGFSFDNTKDAVEVAGQLFASGTPVSVINTYIPADGEGGRTTLKRVVNAGEGGKYYEISTPENVGNVVFGSVANDVTESVIERNSTVNIERYRDPVVAGMTGLSSVSGFVQSMAKYDATVPLTIDYVKGGYTRAVPLYAYRAHGNGRIAALTTSLSGSWTALWSEGEREVLVSNILASNTPDERVDHPYTVTIEQNDHDAYIEIVPGILNPAASTEIVITLPNGKKIERTLDFDARKYSYTFDTGKVGTYTVDIKYSYDDKEFSSVESFEIPYLAEYDAFATFSKANIYEFMRGNGTITEDEIPNLENDRSEITTYNMSYRIPLLIAAIALFLLDVLIRKVKLSRKKKKIRLDR